MVAAIKKISNEDLIKNDILSKVREGSQDVFEDIVKSYQKRVFIHTYGILMNREDAMETTQETFLKLFKSLSSLRDDAKFEPWLFTIANNLCIDKIRKNKKLKLQSTSIDDIPEGAAISNPTYKNDEYQEGLKQTIKNSIHTLPVRQRTIIVMRYFQEMKFHEIAENLSISLGTVKKLHFTAIEKIRERTLKAWSL
jgi:RNA polymerase sigma-70 factor (ECF subfamily)